MGNFNVTKQSDGTFKAVKNPTYTTEITYYSTDGETVDSNPSLSAGYYIVAKVGNDWKYYAEIGTNGSLTWRDSNGNTVSEIPAVSEFKLCKPDNTSNFDSIKNANAINETDTHTFTGLGQNPAIVDGAYHFTAVKKPVYEVEIIYENYNSGDNLGNNYSIYAGVMATNQDGNSVTYYNSQAINLDGTNKTITFNTFNRSNDHPNQVAYEIGNNVNVALVQNLEVEGNEELRGTIKGGTIYGDGTAIGGSYGVSVTQSENKTTYTISKLVPYHYEIVSADNKSITLDPLATSNNWYLLSTLTKADGSTFYAIKPVSLQNQSSITDDIVTYCVLELRCA